MELVISMASRQIGFQTICPQNLDSWGLGPICHETGVIEWKRWAPAKGSLAVKNLQFFLTLLKNFDVKYVTFKGSFGSDSIN